MSEDFLHVVDIYPSQAECKQGKVDGRRPIVGQVFIIPLRIEVILKIIAVKHAACCDSPYFCRLAFPHVPNELLLL